MQIDWILQKMIDFRLSMLNFLNLTLFRITTSYYVICSFQNVHLLFNTIFIPLQKSFLGRVWVYRNLSVCAYFCAFHNFLKKKLCLLALKLFLVTLLFSTRKCVTTRIGLFYIACLSVC